MEPRKILRNGIREIARNQLMLAMDFTLSETESHYSKGLGQRNDIIKVN